MGGWVGEAIENALLDVGVRLVAGDEREDIFSLLDGQPDSNYSPASGISFSSARLLRYLDDDGLEFIVGLLRAVDECRVNHRPADLSPPRKVLSEAVALYLKQLDAPKPVQKRAPRRAKGGNRKAS